jgi:hypothetical protein
VLTYLCIYIYIYIHVNRIFFSLGELGVLIERARCYRRIIRGDRKGQVGIRG